MLFKCGIEISSVKTRGGVEDTGLEANAKDTNKLGQGQGQPFCGQTLSRPRTGMLEAKTKDQGHSRKCFPKKVFKIFFQAISKKKAFKKFFQAISAEGKQKRSLQTFSGGFWRFPTKF